MDARSLVARATVPEVLPEPLDGSTKRLELVPRLPIGVDAGPLCAPHFGPPTDEREHETLHFVHRRVVVARRVAGTPRSAARFPVIRESDSAVTLACLVPTAPVRRRCVTGLSVLVVRDDLDACRPEPVGVVLGHRLDDAHPLSGRSRLGDVVDDRFHTACLDRCGVDLRG